VRKQHPWNNNLFLFWNSTKYAHRRFLDPAPVRCRLTCPLPLRTSEPSFFFVYCVLLLFSSWSVYCFLLRGKVEPKENFQNNQGSLHQGMLVLGVCGSTHTHANLHPSALFPVATPGSPASTIATTPPPPEVTLH
jgi:hypothetical protein